MIPPWVRPENPERIALLDDGTQMFQPQFARGTTQVQIWADPRWQFTRRYRGMRTDQKASLLSALNDARGKGVTVRLTPHASQRGSFPATELLTNSTFENGTTGWEGYQAVLTTAIEASERVSRMTCILQDGITGIVMNTVSSISLTQGVPYVVRAMIKQGRGDLGSVVYAGTAKGSSANGGISSSTGYGMRVAGFTPASTASYFVNIGANTVQGATAGDYLLVPYASLSRCALADNAPNLFLQSESADNAAWTKDDLTVSANDSTNFDGIDDADTLVEDTDNTDHFISQAVTVPTAAADIFLGFVVKRRNRTFCAVRLTEGTGSTSATRYFNLTTGAVGATSATGANWANLRSGVVSLGNDWFYCWIIATKTNAATVITGFLFAASADGTSVYTGAGNAALTFGGAVIARSSVPVRVSTTTSSSSSGTSQNGSGLHLKGLPASTNGLLEVNDWFSFNGELKQATARLNSDAAGLGYLQFRPAIGESPADNDPVEILEPWGRFRLMNGAEYDNMWGTYTDAELEFSEVYE
jgi:hypothetical protein